MEDMLIQKCAAIIGRLRPEGRTPMMRFIFNGWTRGDYEALDHRLAGAGTPTCTSCSPVPPATW